MTLTEPKKRSITGKLLPNKLTERDDGQLAAVNSKFSESEQESTYNTLKEQAKIEL